MLMLMRLIKRKEPGLSRFGSRGDGGSGCCSSSAASGGGSVAARIRLPLGFKLELLM